MESQKAYVSIVDNRDGSVEKVFACGVNIREAQISAFNAANQECADRNRREGWTRFLTNRFGTVSA